ncbi:unnamed protein product [Lactuca virosa]|uniref:Uncharacterized protein n=1 Tax=Lactuca virosa TaxID=75947 RepID=A0AAU9LKT1_9ASTR|nr:unnamed protein product [Lactuca virosa]
MLKQKTSTRSEIEHLTALMHEKLPTRMVVVLYEHQHTGIQWILHVLIDPSKFRLTMELSFVKHHTGFFTDAVFAYVVCFFMVLYS